MTPPRDSVNSQRILTNIAEIRAVGGFVREVKNNTNEISRRPILPKVKVPAREIVFAIVQTPIIGIIACMGNG